MIKDQCNNCRKNGTSSCSKSIIYDSRPCDEYVKKLDLSKQDNQGQTYSNPVQQPALQNSNQQATVNNNQSTFASVFSFKGRIRRTQYWLTNFIIGLLSAPAEISDEMSEGVAIYVLILFIPTTWVYFANIIKRFHDLGRSGWFTCLLFIPIVNIIFAIYAAFFKGQEQDNEYGPNPY
jgi:uncharacterized membrane protein YhaH (DUF805 family)